VELVLMALAAAGLYVSTYFSVCVFRGYRGKRNQWSILPMVSNRCTLVARHHDARIFGVPNSVLGMIYYLLVMFAVALESPMLLMVAGAASLLALAFAVYLFYSLYFKVRIACPLCVFSHAITIAVAIGLALQS
jgi:uncharacterized membrane protein